MLKKQELKELRKEIILDSLFTRDYENSQYIDPHRVQDFFDGYSEFLEDLCQEENGKVDLQWCRQHDTEEALWEYYYYHFEYDPLKPISDFKTFKPTWGNKSFIDELYECFGNTPSRNNYVNYCLIEEFANGNKNDKELYEFLKEEDIDLLFNYARIKKLD